MQNKQIISLPVQNHMAMHIMQITINLLRQIKLKYSTAMITKCLLSQGFQILLQSE